MRKFFTRFPTISRLIIAAIVLALLGLLIWGCWSLAYNQGWVTRAPTWDFASLLTPEPPTDTVPATQPPAPPTEPPTVRPTDPPAPPTQPPAPPTEPPTVRPTDPPAPPTEPPTAPPTPVVTQVPQVVYTPTGKTVSFSVENQTVSMETFTYSGGWMTANDPWFIAKNNGLTKETTESFGMPISGDEWAMRTTNWLKAAVSDPWTLTWFRFQMHLEDFSDMDKANKRAAEISQLPAGEYDKLANEALDKFFKKINGGRAEVDPNWGLEVMLRESNNGTLQLFARTNSDANHTPDLLVAFYAKGESTSFTSYKGAWKVAAKAAGVRANSFRARAYINFTEGGTWKWKPEGGGSTPTDPPTSTPAPVTPTPTPKPRPTKDPSVRPTPPVGGGPVNPENSEDPHTTDHVESTPAPAVTNPPASTPTPTPVPTAVVRPTEECQTAAPTPIREDQNTPPPADPGHNVPTDKPAGEGDDSFDPDSI